MKVALLDTPRTHATHLLVDPLPRCPGDEGNVEEQQYLDLVRDIIRNGVQRGDRTQTGTLSRSVGAAHEHMCMGSLL